MCDRGPDELQKEHKFRLLQTQCSRLIKFYGILKNGNRMKKVIIQGLSNILVGTSGG